MEVALKRRGNFHFVCLVAASALAIGLGLASPSANASLLFDRGLPTDNLNNAAGANRSNVAWADIGTTNSIGDNFSLGGPATVDTIRVWVVGSLAGAASDPAAANSYHLWFGNDNGALTSVADTALSTSVTAVTYANGDGYQGSSGSYRALYEVDFSGLNLGLAGGTYAFAISGPVVTDSGYALTTPFVSASNGPLSGSTQEGDDGFIYGFTSTGAMDTGNGYPWNTLDGWDKTSDINVQVFGTVPEPSSIAFFAIGAIGLLGFGAAQRRRGVTTRA